MKMEEWSDKYNPFNSLKALVHVNYWGSVVKGDIKPPIFVSIDPCGVCNFKCPHCNAGQVLAGHSQMMSEDTAKKIVALLVQWKTKAVCIGGGGESLLNPNTYHLIDMLTEIGVSIGVVTNGSTIHNLNSLKKCTWVGVSVDAASALVYSKMKGVSEIFFQKVLKNMRELSLSVKELSFKFLLHPNNCHEVYEATKLAKDIGCSFIHIRPGADPWFDMGNKNFDFTCDSVKKVREDIQKAREDFESKIFRVYGITHKFSPELNVRHNFSQCRAVFTTCVIDATGAVSLCCDRRGDPALNLCSIEDAPAFWGGERHKEIAGQIVVDSCPRCTYSHVNEIFENVIINDKMMCAMF
jgi:MoaA/NifB/PqqE/SkfB family radical SAM enzyme